MAAPPHDTTAPAFYAACAETDIAVQHMLYDAGDFDLLDRLVLPGLVVSPDLQLIFVLGRYSDGQESDMRDLDAFLDRIGQRATSADWAVCAFGRAETACLEAAHAKGGKLRVRIDNTLVNDDGTPARDNADRVAVIARIIEDQHGQI